MMAFITGFIAGLVHVVSGADHLAAVAPLSMQEKHRAWNVGLRWGFGHAGGVILVGGLAVLLKEVLPLEQLAGWAERTVGVMLIGIGLWGLRKSVRFHLHTHEHIHDGMVHAHAHSHAAGHPAVTPPKPHRHTHAAFAIGTLHGLAGSSHLLGVVPALMFASQWESAAYLAAFGLGTIIAMASFSSAMGWLAHGCARRGTLVFRSVMAGCSLAALGVGIWWLALNFTA